MKEQTLFITIQVKVNSNLNVEDLIDEFSSNSIYEFSDTDNVKVISTEWIDANL